MEKWESWSELKAHTSEKTLAMQYEDYPKWYRVWAAENGMMYMCDIEKTDPANTDQTDFETNYKDDCNKPLQPKTDDGKLYTRSESRPLDMTTCFTCRGDSATVVGAGTPFQWNAANSGEFEVVDSNFKRKVIDLGFRDEVCIKEGALYWWDASWGCELSFWSYLPAAYSPTQEDLFMDNFVVSHLFHGDCPMGDELNTECASGRIPNYLRHQIWITVPTADVLCRGHVSLEIYRTNTI